jgi:hypothetical protein
MKAVQNHARWRFLGIRKIRVKIELARVAKVGTLACTCNLFANFYDVVTLVGILDDGSEQAANQSYQSSWRRGNGEILDEH